MKTSVFVSPDVLKLPIGGKFQFERRGYYIVDASGVFVEIPDGREKKFSVLSKKVEKKLVNRVNPKKMKKQKKESGKPSQPAENNGNDGVNKEPAPVSSTSQEKQ